MGCVKKSELSLARSDYLYHSQILSSLIFRIKRKNVLPAWRSFWHATDEESSTKHEYIAVAGRGQVLCREITGRRRLSQ